MNPRQIAKGLVVAAALTAASGLAGCAGALAVNRRSPGTVENGMFKPSLPPAANYGPDPGRACPQRGVFGMVQDQMNERFKGKATPEPEGRLCAMAETLLGWQGADNDFPPESVRQFLSAYFGLPLTVRQMLITNVDSENDRQIADALGAPIASFAATAQVPRYGLVTTRVKKGVTKAVLVMQDQALELSPIPRKLAPGSSATLEGRVRGTIAKPKAEISTVAGKLQSVPPSADKSIRTQLECGDKPGKIVVQITGENEGADVFLASFPVACGGAELASAVPLPGKQQAESSNPATAEQRLLELTNADRTAAGLKPLEDDAALAKIARGVSEARAKGKGTSSTELMQALKEADIAAPLILESAVQALDAGDAYARLSSSPADRANSMNPEVTQIGVGVAPGAPVDNRPTIVVTELFVKQLPPPDADEVKANLYQAIARRRGDARAGAVAKDAQLEQIAQAYASEMAKQNGKVPKERIAEIEAPLYKSFATVNEIGGVKADPLEFAEEPSIVGDAKAVGVGVGVGSSPQFGKNSTYVVILMGKRPTAKAPAATRQPVKKK